MLFWLASIALSALVIFALGRTSSSFVVDGAGAAVLTAAALTGAGVLRYPVLTPILAALTTRLVGSPCPAAAAALWVRQALHFGFSFITTAACSLARPSSRGSPSRESGACCPPCCYAA